MSEPLPPPSPLDDAAFDQALIAACFELAATEGWRNLRIAVAARAAGLPLARARLRFPSRTVLLIRLGRIADAASLAEVTAETTLRDRLFGMLMRRLDVFQTHREGVLALLQSLPLRPQTALFLGLLTEASMSWLLSAAGAGTTGLAGRLRVKGLTAVWLWTVRAWQRDETADLAPTMAALDAALTRAERAAGWLSSLPFARRRAAPEAHPQDAAAAEAAKPPPDGQPPDGQSPDGRSPDGQSPDGQSPDGRSPDGQSPDGQSPEGQSSGGPATD